MDPDDLPLISLSAESTDFDAPAPAAPPAPAKKAPPPAAEAKRPDAIVKPPTEISRPVPAPEARKPSTEVRAAPPRPAPAPAAPATDDDPEKLLREYQERQKRKMAALEQQVAELRRITAERDAFKSKSETLGRELLEARKQLDAAAKQADTIRDLQQKVDAALLSHSMMSTETAKLKMRVQELEGTVKKADEKAAHAERSLGEAQKQLAQQSEGRKAAEAKIAAVLKALQDPAPGGSAPDPRAASGAKRP